MLRDQKKSKTNPNLPEILVFVYYVTVVCELENV